MEHDKIHEHTKSPGHTLSSLSEEHHKVSPDQQDVNNQENAMKPKSETPMIKEEEINESLPPSSFPQGNGAEKLILTESNTDESKLSREVNNSESKMKSSGYPSKNVGSDFTFPYSSAPLSHSGSRYGSQSYNFDGLSSCQYPQLFTPYYGYPGYTGTQQWVQNQNFQQTSILRSGIPEESGQNYSYSDQGWHYSPNQKVNDHSILENPTSHQSLFNYGTGITEQPCADHMKGLDISPVESFVIIPESHSSYDFERFPDNESINPNQMNTNFEEVRQPNSQLIQVSSLEVEVSNLPVDVNEESLKIFFQKKNVIGCDDVSLVSVNIDKESNTALLKYDKSEAVTYLVQQMTINYHGHKIKIRSHLIEEPANKNENRVLKISGFSPSITIDYIELYFENAKRAGCEAKSVDCSKFDQNGYVLVTYNSTADAEIVLNKDHFIDNAKLHVTKLDANNPPEIKTVKVTGFEPSSRIIEIMEMYFESSKRCGAEAENVQFDEYEKCLYVTFNTPQDAVIVCERRHEIAEYYLTVILYNPEQPCTPQENNKVVKVSGFKNTSKNYLELYFESEKKFGAKAEDILFDDKEECFYVTMVTKEDAELVCKRDHKVHGCKLQVALNKQSQQTPVVKTMVKISGYKESLSESKIQTYLENKIKFGAVPEKIEYNSEEKCLFVTLTSSADAAEVCKRRHKLGGDIIKVDIYTPPPILKNKILVSNISENTNKETLINYLEGKLETEILESDILYSDDGNIAVFTCKTDEYDEIFNKATVLKRRPLNKQVLSIFPVYVSRVAKVTNFKDGTNEEDLTNYFENKKKSSGGDVEKVELNKEEGYALIYFQDYKDLENVCQTSHVLGGSKVDVVVYQKCLGIYGGMKDPQNFSIPKSFDIHLKSFDMHKMMFIFQTKINTDGLRITMETCHCNVDFIADKNVTLSCTLSTKIKDGRKLAQKWTAKCESSFYKHLKSLEITEFKLLREVADEVLKEVPTPDKKDVFIFHEADSSIVVVGCNEAVFKDTTSAIKELAGKIEDDMERKRKEITEKVSFRYPYSTIKSLGLIDEIKQKCDKLEVSSNLKGDVEFKGILSDITAAKAAMYEYIENVRFIEITDLKSTQIQLLVTNEIKDSTIKEHFGGKKDIAVWESNENNTSLKIISKNAESLERAIITLKNTISYMEIPLSKESSHLLSLKDWQMFLEKIYTRYPNVVKIYSDIESPMVYITAISEINKLIADEVQIFFINNTIYEKVCTFQRGKDRFIKKHFTKEIEQITKELKEFRVHIKLQSGETGINIKGTKEGFEQAIEKLDNLKTKIGCREKCISVASYCKFINSRKGKYAIDKVEGSYRCIVEFEEDVTNEDIADVKNVSDIGMFLYNDTIIRVVKGDITALSVDVIVNAANENMAHIGGLAKAIVVKGGQKIQDECSRHVFNNGKILDGECMISSSGRLPCKQIIHAVGPLWKGGRYLEKDKLEEAILRTLEMVMSHGYSSVAIPAISTGIYQYPIKQATDVIVEAISHHFKRVRNSTIKLIYLIDLNTNTLTHFNTALQVREEFITQRRNEERLSYRQPQQEKVQSYANRTEGVVESVSSDTTFNPKIVSGEIATVKADVIVNSASQTLSLSNGAVSGSILKAGGQSLQSECAENYPQGVGFGDIAETGSGNLKCQKVFHCVLDTYKKSPNCEKNLENLIMKCLHKAETDGYGSIAFPAIGTGNLRYPSNVVARIFFQTIRKYKANEGSLNDITFVVYPGDSATVAAFSNESKSPIGYNKENKKTEKQWKKKKESRGAEAVPAEDWEIVSEEDLAKGIDIGKIKLTVGTGNILDVNIPAIVNSSNSDLDLSKGAVSQAILKAGGENMKKECLKQSENMIETGIAVTKSKNLKCKYVIHIDADRFLENWKQAIVKCLKKADSLKLTALAFPALGTGTYSTKTEVFAEAIYDALIINSNKMTHLQDVHVVIYQHSMLKPFIRALQNLIQKKSKSKGYFQRFKDGLKYVVSSFMPDSKEKDDSDSSDDEDTQENVAERNDLSLSVYSDTPSDIAKAMEEIDNAHNIELHRVSVPLESALSSKYVNQIMMCEILNSVDIHIEQRLKRVIIYGLSSDVSDVVQKVTQIILAAVTKIHDEKNAEILQNIVQWHRLEGNDRKEYPKHINRKIEEAFMDKKVDVTLRYNSEDVTIDFATMEENNKGITVSVIRRDKVKEFMSEIPSLWLIGDDTNLKIVPLTPGQPEYQQVVTNFGLPKTIHKIERIENPSLHRQYMAKKKHMELELPGKTVEQPILWHGTDQTSIPNINNYGFNRSYCGKNATVYGQGVYFAVATQYSTNYAKPNNQGQCQMYQCKVLVGEYAQGNQAYRVPPNKPLDKGVFESLVDNMANPGMYIIFNDTQAYPEYLITFT